MQVRLACKNRQSSGDVTFFFLLHADFTPPLPATQRSKIHVGILAGAIAGSLFLFLLIIGILYKTGCLGEKVSADKGK